MRERTERKNVERIQGIKRETKEKMESGGVEGEGRKKEEEENVEERMDLSLLRKLSLRVC